MDMRSALNTAVEFEKKVRDTYLASMEKSTSDLGKKILRLMASEEKDHVRYLESKLAALESTPVPSADDLTSLLPSKKEITDAAETLETKLEGGSADAELALLQKVRDVEVETNTFYRNMVDTLPPEGAAFFQRFVEIENGHLYLVESEIDHLQHNGAWIAIDHGELRNF